LAEIKGGFITLPVKYSLGFFEKQKNSELSLLELPRPPFCSSHIAHTATTFLV
jgi:hypothetical protein